MAQCKKPQTPFKKQEDFIAEILKFSGDKPYFGSFCSSDINRACGSIRQEYVSAYEPSMTRWVDVGHIDAESMKKSILKLMHWNPVRWAGSIQAVRESVYSLASNVPEPFAIPMQNELKLFLNKNSKLSGQWNAEIAGQILLRQELGNDGRLHPGSSYWKLRALSNVAKEICKINFHDFKNKKEPEHRDIIINVMADDFPTIIQPQHMNMYLDTDPNQPFLDLFKQYRWINAKDWKKKYGNIK